MSDKIPAQSEAAKSEKPDTMMHLMLSMADTTWRMFTPPAIFVPAGIFMDLKFHTKPWITILSAVVGLAISIMLVKRQLRRSE